MGRARSIWRRLDCGSGGAGRWGCEPDSEARPRSDSGRAGGSQPVGRARDAEGSPVEDVGVDHRGAQVAVAEELLDGADVRAVLEQVCRERVSERVAGDALGDAGQACGALHDALNRRLMEVVAKDGAGAPIHSRAQGGEDPVPAPIEVGVPELLAKRAGQPGADAVLTVALLEGAHSF